MIQNEALRKRLEVASQRLHVAIARIADTSSVLAAEEAPGSARGVLERALAEINAASRDLQTILRDLDSPS
jgi:hypothetical protein